MTQFDHPEAMAMLRRDELLLLRVLRSWMKVRKSARSKGSRVYRQGQAASHTRPSDSTYSCDRRCTCQRSGRHAIASARSRCGLDTTSVTELIASAAPLTSFRCNPHLVHPPSHGIDNSLAIPEESQAIDRGAVTTCLMTVDCHVSSSMRRSPSLAATKQSKTDDCHTWKS